MRKIIIISGAPGVGKTETAQELIKHCPNQSVLLDLDKIVGIHPFIINNQFYDLLLKNMEACLHNFENWGAKVIVISGVLIVPELLLPVQKLEEQSSYQWSCYGLYCNHALLENRIINDTKPQDKQGRLSCMALNEELLQIKAFTIIENSEISIEETAKRIAVEEDLIH